MNVAEDVLAELASLGAVGDDALPKLSLEQVELISGAPPAPMVDKRGVVTVGELSELAGSLRRIADEAERAAAACERLANTWSGAEIPPPAPVQRDMADNRPPPGQPAPVYEARNEPPLAPTISPEERERAIEMARRKIRGEHLSEDVRSELMHDKVGPRDPDAPAISLPESFSPSYPEEATNGQVQEEG